MGRIHVNQNTLATFSVDRRLGGSSRRGLQSSRAMRPPHSPGRGVLRLFAFFAILATAMLMTDWTINCGMRRIRTSSFGVSNRIMTGQINADIVISGSSRALTHYDPRIIEAITHCSTFDIGVNGSQTDMQLAVLRAYLRHNRKPRLVIHNLDLFSFSISHEIYNPAQYVPYLKEESIYTGVRRVYPDAWKWKYLPLYGYAVEDMSFNWILGLGALAGIQPKEDHFNGYLPRYRSWTDDFERFRDANPKGVLIPVEEQGVQDFKDLIEFCVGQDIRVLAVYSPEYYEMQAIERNRAEILSKMKEITDPFKVPIWDYSDSYLSQERSNFYNSQHLNANGATMFSTDLAHRLLDADVVGATRISR
jgi:hypothetical protein